MKRGQRGDLSTRTIAGHRQHPKLEVLDDRVGKQVESTVISLPGRAKLKDVLKGVTLKSRN